MKRYLVELPVWCLVVTLLLTAIWAGYALTITVNRDSVGGLAVSFPWIGDGARYRYDGSLVAYVRFSSWRSPVHVILSRTVWGLIAFWWPAIASIGAGLLTLLVALLPITGPLVRKRIRIPRVRLTLFRMMVVIGTVSAWLWLGRLDAYTRILGALVFGFTLYAGFRRGFLAREAKVDGADAKVLSRVGIAGYALVLLLALAWVISILVWVSYQERRF
ncbi:MAG: hypothetical protein ACLQIB_36275 [Isosphaeraceae bacterium]